MTRSLYAMHERCPLDILPDGWILYIAEVGDGSDPHPGIDLRDETRARMVRIQWLFGEHGGCYPPIDRRAGFLQRVESLAANTPDCHAWIAGNEPNLSVEGLHTPEYTADMYNAIRLAVRMQAGHEDDVVLLPPVGPWNVESGIGWIEYFVTLIDLCLAIDGFAIHTYSRGADPASVTSEAKMGAPYEHLYSGFRTYRDWLAAIPQRFRDRPVYVTETNQNDEWLNENNGWVQAAYKEIDDWNHTPGAQQIRAMLIYRWPRFDKYYIEGKSGVIADFKAAQEHGYEIPGEEQPPVAEWRTVYINDCEGANDSGFYDQGGAPEVTIPKRTHLHWIQGPGEGDYPRPEADHKRRPQREVYEGDYSASVFYISAEGQVAYVTDPIAVQPGDPIRGSVMYMHVFDGEAAGGSQCGIVLGASPFDSEVRAWPKGGSNPFEHESIRWGPWRSTYDQDDGYLPNRQWVKLETPEVQHGVSSVRLIVRFNANQRGAFSGVHYDLYQVEAYTDTQQPPPGNGCDLSKLYGLVADSVAIIGETIFDMCMLIEKKWRDAE